MPKVRVYLLTYRRNDLRPRALKSLLAQTFTDWVCELHNDDPTDPFPAQLAVETADLRILSRPYEKNLGATRAFNLVFAPVAHAWLAGRLGELAPLAGFRDWRRVAAQVLRRPRSFWRVLRARRNYPELWTFLLDVTAKRFAESTAQGISGWGPRRPVSP